MIIWSGFGILIPLIAAVCVGVPLSLAEGLHNDLLNGLILSAGFLATGFAIRSVKRAWLGYRRDSLFFIPWHIWAYIAWVVAGLSLIACVTGGAA